MKYIGAYVPSEPTVVAVPEHAHALGAMAIGMTTAPTNVYTVPDPDQATCQAFKDACRQYDFTAAQILPHAGFLINAGSPDKRKLALSRKALADEMRRCRLLGLTMINFHPGATLNQVDDETCLRTIAESINIVLDKEPGVKAVIENTAGQGSNLGWSFEHLGYIIEHVDDKSRVGVCIDTCHAHAAGYDLSTPEGYEHAWAEFDRYIGMTYLSGMHLNDAKRPAGSRIDRHESIGIGTIGAEFFRRLLADSRTNNIPLLLETPDEARWPEEIKQLYGYSVTPQ